MEIGSTEIGNWKSETRSGMYRGRWLPWPIGARTRAREPIDHGISVTDRCQG